MTDQADKPTLTQNLVKARGQRQRGRLGAPYELQRGAAVSKAARAATPKPSRPPVGGMAIQRQIAFWLAALAVFILLLWLLSEILLPFIAGLAIAYLLTPLTDRLERAGVNRLVAALTIITQPPPLAPSALSP